MNADLNKTPVRRQLDWLPMAVPFFFIVILNLYVCPYRIRFSNVIWGSMITLLIGGLASFGFTIYLNEKEKLTCCGDEPYNESERMYVQGSRWLLHEAFCLDAEEEKYHAYEKHHSTVKDACVTAEKLHVENLVLYHTEDSDMASRKARYTAEGKAYFSGNLYVPDDLEVIDLD